MEEWILLLPLLVFPQQLLITMVVLIMTLLLRFNNRPITTHLHTLTALAMQNVINRGDWAFLLILINAMIFLMMPVVRNIQLVHICINASSAPLILVLSLFVSITGRRAISKEVVLQRLTTIFFALISFHLWLLPLCCFDSLRNCYVLIQISLLLILKHVLLITELLNGLRKLFVDFLLLVFIFMFALLLTVLRHVSMALVFTYRLLFTNICAVTFLTYVVIFEDIQRCIVGSDLTDECTFVFLWSELHVLLVGDYLMILVLNWNFTRFLC